MVVDTNGKVGFSAPFSSRFFSIASNAIGQTNVAIREVVTLLTAQMTTLVVSVL